MIKIRIRKTLAYTAVGCLVMTASLYATPKKENIELARINSVLNSVFPLIDQAQKEAVPNERVHFHYDWLKKDIHDIQAGIAQKINTPDLTPQVITPLRVSLSNQGAHDES